jgi:ABC-2 type transport system ATP-binding protein
MTGSESSGSVPAIEMRDVVRRFGGVTALDHLSLEVRRGELYGLLGPDGAGKTTAIRSMAALVRTDGGSVRIYGQDPSHPSVRERLGLMPQQYSLYPDLSVRENLEFFARLNVLPRSIYRARAARLLDITRLAPFLERRAAALSGGMYKKLALACALLHEPDVLLLDEPTNGVDPVSRRELWSLLHEFSSNRMSILISTPYMDEAERCHRVGLLHHGRLLLEGEPERLLDEFEDEAFEVSGVSRDVLEAGLSALPSVISFSPAGTRLKLVARKGSESELEAALRPLGAMLRRVLPEFEDLYLARLRAEAA